MIRTLLRLVASRQALGVLDQGIVSGTSFLTSIAIGRLAGEAELGVYTVGLSVALLVSAVQDSTISIPYIFFRERGPGERAAAGSVLLYHLTLAAAAAVLLALAALLLSAVPGATRLAAAAVVLAVTVPGVLAHELSRRLAFAHGDMRGALAVDVAAATLQLGALAALALTGNLTAATGLFALGVGRGIAGAVRLFLVRHSFDLRAATWRSLIQQHWRFARADLAAQIVGVTEGYAVYWILALVGNADALGILAASTTVAMMANPVLLGLHNLFVAQIADAHAEGGRSAVWRHVRRATFLHAAPMAGFSILLVVFGGRILELLYGPAFAGHGTVVAIVAVLAFTGAAELTTANGLRAVGRPDGYLWAGVAGLVTIAVLAFPLGSAYGAAGAAAAALAGGVVEVSVEWAWLRHLCTRATG